MTRPVLALGKAVMEMSPNDVTAVDWLDIRRVLQLVLENGPVAWRHFIFSPTKTFMKLSRKLRYFVQEYVMMLCIY